MPTFDEFQKHWINQRVADPLLGSVGIPQNEWYQCVSLVKQYINECFGIPNGYYGNAIDWWTATPGAVLAQFDKIPTTSVAKGDIVPLRTAGHNDFTEPGHIVLATGNQNDTQFEAFEQNGATGGGTGLNGDAIRTRWISKSRIAGVLRQKPLAPPRTPKDYMTYTPVTEPTTLRTTLSPTSWWNLSNDSTDPGGFHPAATLNQYTPVAIGGYAVNSHFASNTYAMIPEDFARAVAGDYSTNNGINTRDLEAIPPPPKTTPSAPIKGTPVETYALVTNVSCFDTSGQASMHKGVAKTLGVGIYIIWSKDDRNNMLNLTDDNMKNKNWWVNPNDNILPEPKEEPHVPIPTPEPVPTPVPVKVEATPPVVQAPAPRIETEADIRKSFQYFVTTKEEVPMKVIKPTMAIDVLHHGEPIPLNPGDKIPTYGTFMAGGYCYVRVQKKSDTNGYYLYGIRATNRNNPGPYLVTDYTLLDHIWYLTEEFYDKSRKSFDGIFKPLLNIVNKKK